MSGEISPLPNCAALTISNEHIVKAMEIINKNYDMLLKGAERSVNKSTSMGKIQCQVKELQDLVEACEKRLTRVQVCISDLQKQDTHAHHSPASQNVSCPDLVGEWHFLYREDNSIFGYMKLVPDTVSETTENDSAGGVTSIRRAEFTIPLCVLREAREASDDNRAHKAQAGMYVLCPCCKMSFEAPQFWKHALIEIAENGNRVRAAQYLDPSQSPRWIVEQGWGWSNPIYRPRWLDNTCDIGQSLADLQLKPFLSDIEFSEALDRVFRRLGLQLTA